MTEEEGRGADKTMGNDAGVEEEEEDEEDEEEGWEFLVQRVEEEVVEGGDIEGVGGVEDKEVGCWGGDNMEVEAGGGQVEGGG